MNINEFSQQIKAYLEEKTQNRSKICISEVIKNNGIKMVGLSILEDENNVAPTFYLEEYFARHERGENLAQLGDDLYRMHEKYKLEHSVEVDFFLDYEKAKEHIVYRLVNKEKNKELLKRLVYFDYMDLAIVFYYLLEEEPFGTGSILIHESHRSMWGVSAEELYETAHKNTPRLLPVCLHKVSALLEEMARDEEQRSALKEELAGCEFAMYILTNKRGMDGAATILYDGCLKRTAGKLGGGFYVIPSSIHEVLLVMEDCMEEEGMNEMVRDVNRTHLDPKEILADHVYYYDEKEDKLISCP